MSGRCLGCGTARVSRDSVGPPFVGPRTCGAGHGGSGSLYLWSPTVFGGKGAQVLPSQLGGLPVWLRVVLAGSVAGKGMESLAIELPWAKQGSRQVAQTWGEGPGVQG